LSATDPVPAAAVLDIAVASAFSLLLRLSAAAMPVNDALTRAALAAIIDAAGAAAAVPPSLSLYLMSTKLP
jgi:hypothetical protein